VRSIIAKRAEWETFLAHKRYCGYREVPPQCKPDDRRIRTLQLPSAKALTVDLPYASIHRE